MKVSSPFYLFVVQVLCEYKKIRSYSPDNLMNSFILRDPDGILTHDLQNRNLNLSIDIQVFKYLL